METILTAILTAAGTGAVTWVFSRQKSKAEVRKVTAEAVELEIGNAKAVINFWKETAEDLTKQLHEMKSDMSALSLKFDELIDELELVRKENGLLRQRLEHYEQKTTI